MGSGRRQKNSVRNMVAKNSNITTPCAAQSCSEPPYLESQATLEPQAIIWLGLLTKTAQLDGFWLGAKPVATLVFTCFQALLCK